MAFAQRVFPHLTPRGPQQVQGGRRQRIDTHESHTEPYISPPPLCSGPFLRRLRGSKPEEGSQGGRLLPRVSQVCGEMFCVAFLRLAGAKVDMLPILPPLPGCSGALCLVDMLGPGSGFPGPLMQNGLATQQSACSCQLARTGSPRTPDQRGPGPGLRHLPPYCIHSGLLSGVQRTRAHCRRQQRQSQEQAHNLDQYANPFIQQTPPERCLGYSADQISKAPALPSLVFECWRPK